MESKEWYARCFKNYTSFCNLDAAQADSNEIILVKDWKDAKLGEKIISIILGRTITVDGSKYILNRASFNKFKRNHAGSKFSSYFNRLVVKQLVNRFRIRTIDWNSAPITSADRDSIQQNRIP